MKMDKCVYCHKEIEKVNTFTAEKNGDQLTCCSDVCKQKTSAFLNYFEKTKLYFYIGIFLSVGLVMAGVIVNAMTNSITLLAVLMAGGFILLGIIIILFPFATPQLFTSCGIRKALRIVRLVGIVIILLGPIMALYLLQ
jgi:hypothetical protein